jgi:phage recombination protein Bet
LPEPLFKLNARRQAVPVAPGEPDGRTNLSAAQAADATGDAADELLALWYGVWGRLVTHPPPPAEAAPTPAATAPPTAAVPPLEVPRQPAPAAGSVVLNRGEFARVRDDVLDIIHSVYFPGLDDRADVVDALRYAERRKLDVWARHVWAKREVNEDGSPGRLHVGATIEGFRAIAHRTGKYAGSRYGKVRYRKGDRSVPYEVTAYVTRIVDGVPREFEGIANYEELYGGPNPYHDKQPRGWLRKCALAAALRDAFPDELGGLYTPDEMAKRFARNVRHGDQPVQRAGGPLLDRERQGHERRQAVDPEDGVHRQQRRHLPLRI